jgi:hypothetical protein
MPQANGQLTDDEKKIILGWLKERWKQPDKCPICGDDQWSVADHMVYPLNYAGGSLIMGGPNYPQVMLISNKCGYTIYFNAALMGLLSEPKAAADIRTAG